MLLLNLLKQFLKSINTAKKCVYSFVKDKTTGDNGKKIDSHISEKDYLTCNKIWNELNMKNMGDYQKEKRCFVIT